LKQHFQLVQLHLKINCDGTFVSDPHRFDLVELALNIEGEQLMASQAEKVERKLSLLLKDDAVIQVRELRQVSSHCGWRNARKD